ncbi:MULTISPECIES: TetR/AcrR family transcriptional regulator [Burkholderia]|uniref:TetR/AcrR family transcriptional regulator n=1 Tax=Burkholderia TaxID=32008 RepID=UPI0005C70712|nr:MULTISPECIES: TetR/AcrR family transcriptional regulator [Burkholderia]MBL3961522.1 TetR/AcrR family transcriptional regulator [Burkholderia sp. KCJ3K979]MCA7963633.1 TetR/AcrR family transcriptional regulator [Burkholderia cenocepacia]MDR8053071.1 TetR/AcrR family transcriptional regulator [Burkholderia cenocepacia]MDR8063520.1 TetR/AcrR family transcriptional regulator [Burkholderia cenocepacia]RQU74580.1 TetR/AcrR family transcriptional regulator [Burkholderia cenocepacia]
MRMPMPNTTSRRTRTPSPAAPNGQAPSSPEVREPRGARRKRETRARLLDAAFVLMAQKGMEGVAINEITEAADVGFGSFYNHFESKEAIHAAVLEIVFEEFADTLDRIAGSLTDPAEIISVSLRHTLLRARSEPVWGQFLLREGLSMRALSRGLGPRLLRDIQKGILAGRFSASDPLMSVITVGGAVLTAIAIELRFDADEKPVTDMLNMIGYSQNGFAERAASSLLQTLGVPRTEATEIANRPLPPAVTSAPEESPER